jgi:hypothetical protein
VTSADSQVLRRVITSLQIKVPSNGCILSSLSAKTDSTRRVRAAISNVFVVAGVGFVDEEEEEKSAWTFPKPKEKAGGAKPLTGLWKPEEAKWVP